MKNPKLVGEIVSKMASAIKKPLTVKIRKGFTEGSVNAVEIAKIIEASGAAAIAVHGRTREQYYAGKADWDIIQQKVLAPAIACETLDPDIKKSVVDTLDRLRKKSTAREIVDFFNDALDAKRGKVYGYNCGGQGNTV